MVVTWSGALKRTVACVGGRIDVAGKQDGNDKRINSDDTSHDDRNQALLIMSMRSAAVTMTLCTHFHYKVGSKCTNARNAYPRLCRSDCCSCACY